MPKLYFGSRGGVYYRKKGRKVYVTNRFGAVPIQRTFPSLLYDNDYETDDETVNEMDDDETVNEETLEIVKTNLNLTIRGTISREGREERDIYPKILYYINHILCNGSVPIQVNADIERLAINIINTVKNDIDDSIHSYICIANDKLIQEATQNNTQN